MTKNELYTAYAALLSGYLSCNSAYIKNWRVFDEPSMYRQSIILTACNVYLKFIKFYINNYDIIIELIDISKLFDVIGELTKQIKLFKTYYRNK